MRLSESKALYRNGKEIHRIYKNSVKIHQAWQTKLEDDFASDAVSRPKWNVWVPPGDPRVSFSGGTVYFKADPDWMGAMDYPGSSFIPAADSIASVQILTAVVGPVDKYYDTFLSFDFPMTDGKRNACTIDIECYNGTLWFDAYICVANAWTQITNNIPFVNGTWVRLRMAATTMYWESSPDGVVWTTRASQVVPFSMASARATIGCGGDDVGAVSARFDNFRWDCKDLLDNIVGPPIAQRTTPGVSTHAVSNALQGRTLYTVFDTLLPVGVDAQLIASFGTNSKVSIGTAGAAMQRVMVGTPGSPPTRIMTRAASQTGVTAFHSSNIAYDLSVGRHIGCSWMKEGDVGFGTTVDGTVEYHGTQTAAGGIPLGYMALADPQSSVKPVAAYLFMGEHTTAIRRQISAWLARTYGAPIPAGY